MSDEQDVRVESGASPEVQREARAMGWQPPEMYKGSPDKFMDADVYIDRGKHVLPIVNATNQRLRAELEQQKQIAARQEAALREAQEAIASLKEYQSEETKRQVEKARKDLIKEIAAARENGDTELEVELTSSLSELKQVVKETKDDSSSQQNLQQPQAPKPHPDFESWALDNASWWGVDADLTALTNAKARQLRSDPANNGLVGRAFFERAAQEAREKLYGKQERKVSKTEGGGGGGASVSSGGKTFKDLPADARTACHDPKRMAKLVGEGKPFKDKAAWEAHYVKEYFSGEE